jgi:hypothetical protein
MSSLDKKLKHPANKKFNSQRILPSEKDLIKIEILASIGLGIHAIASDLGISHDVVERWRKEFPQIDAAIASGRLKAKKRAYSCIFEQAFPIDDNGRPTRDGDTSLMIFYAKTRYGWKERAQEINLNTKDAPNLVFALKNAIENQADEVISETKTTRPKKKN